MLAWTQMMAQMAASAEESLGRTAEDVEPPPGSRLPAAGAALVEKSIVGADSTVVAFLPLTLHDACRSTSTMYRTTASEKPSMCVQRPPYPTPFLYDATLIRKAVSAGGDGT